MRRTLAEVKRTRWWWIIGLLALGAVSCGGGSLTATEYAETVEGLVADMEQRFVALDATQGRELLEGVPWLPAERREVIEVAFGCPPQP